MAIVTAFEVLGNPKKKAVYDRYGEFGLTVLEKTGSPGITDFILNTQKQAWIIFLVMILLLLFLSFPFLVSFKLSGRFKLWPWALLCTPLWVFHAVVYGLIILFAVLTLHMTREAEAAARDAGEELEKTPGGRWIYWWLALYPFVIAFTLGIVFKADNLTPTITWPQVFMPYFIFEMLYLVMKSFRIRKAHLDWPGGDPVLPLVPNAFPFFIYQELRWTFIRSILGLVVLAELSTFKPSVLAEIGFILESLLLAASPIIDLMYWRAYKFAARESRHAERLPNRMITAFSFILYIFGLMILMTFLGLMYARISAEAAMSWIWVFFPLLLVAGLLAGTMVLCMPCVFCCCIVRDDTLYDDMQQPPRNATGSIKPTAA